MEPIRTVPTPGAISSIDEEELPTGTEPTHPEATPPFVEGERPASEPATELLLETTPQ
jgi:hypothetical protein